MELGPVNREDAVALPTRTPKTTCSKRNHSFALSVCKMTLFLLINAGLFPFLSSSRYLQTVDRLRSSYRDSSSTVNFGSDSTRDFKVSLSNSTGLPFRGASEKSTTPTAIFLSICGHLTLHYRFYKLF